MNNINNPESPEKPGVAPGLEGVHEDLKNAIS